MIEEVCKECGYEAGEHYQDIAGMPLMCEPFGTKKFKPVKKVAKRGK